MHFTLEDASGSGRGPGESRVNTGFFAVRTTPFARDFFERAWAVNDCGRGQSDQRSINYVLGRTNGDDQECTADGAVAEWLALATRHGGHATATSKVGDCGSRAGQEIAGSGEVRDRAFLSDALSSSLVFHAAGALLQEAAAERVPTPR